MNAKQQALMTRLKKKPFKKKYLYYFVAFILLCLCGFYFLNINNENDRLNSFLVHQHSHTEQMLSLQHKEYTSDQSKLDTLTEYHDMFNNYYLELHPHIKNPKQLLKSSSYMNMSKRTTDQNNYLNNQMTDLKLHELKEKKQLPHEYKHSILGNNNNELNQSKFNHKQNHLKYNTFITFTLGFFAFIAFVVGLNYKSWMLNQKAKQLDIKQKEMDIKELKKEYGDTTDI